MVAYLSLQSDMNLNNKNIIFLMQVGASSNYEPNMQSNFYKFFFKLHCSIQQFNFRQNKFILFSSFQSSLALEISKKEKVTGAPSSNYYLCKCP